jgi:hypothetical protein
MSKNSQNIKTLMNKFFNIFSIKSLCFLMLLSGLTTTKNYAQSGKIFPKIDQRVEFLNIVYYLATDAQIVANPFYFNQVEQYFKPFKKHSCLSYLQEIIRTYQKDSIDIKEWELPSLAVHLNHEMMPAKFTQNKNEIDAWDNRRLVNDKKLTKLLTAFYRQTNVKGFFESQKAYFTAIENQFLQDSVSIDGTWLANYFSLPKSEEYYPIHSLLFGNQAYMRTNFSYQFRHSFTLFGCEKHDHKGMPQCNKTANYHWALLHESIHCYANQIIEADTTTWKKIGLQLLSVQGVMPKVQRTFYGNWRYILYETLVRAIAIKYAQAHQSDLTLINADIEQQKKLGFVWMPDFLACLNRYEQGKNEYKNLMNFSAEMQSFFKNHVSLNK